MYSKHICVASGARIVKRSEAGELPALLEKLAEAGGGRVVSVRREKGEDYLAAGSCCGFVYLPEGVLIELLPRVKGGPAEARKALCAELCRRYGLPFVPSAFDPERNFMESFVSLFANETMKIVKSGVLSTYTTCEENSTSVQGVILFSENMRRNLVHRERVYVRRDVFTSDRAENRIIKAGAAKLAKLTADPRSAHLLKEALSFLDEAASPRDIAAEFGRCVNARNAKKYSAVLGMCRSIFGLEEGSLLPARAAACAQLFELSL